MSSVRLLPHESVLFRYKTENGTFPFWFTRLVPLDGNSSTIVEIPREEVIAKMQELVPIDHPNGYMVVEGLRWGITVAKPGMLPRRLDYRNNSHIILGLEKYVADGQQEGVHPSYPFLESGWTRFDDFRPSIPKIKIPDDAILPPSPPTPDEIEDDEAPTANDGAIMSGGGYVPYPTVDFINLLKNEASKRLGVNADQIVYRIEVCYLSEDGTKQWDERNEYCYLLNAVNLGGLGINFYDWYVSDSPISWAKHGNAIFFNKLKSVGKGVVYYVEFSCH